MQARSRFSTPLKKRRHCEITSLYINEINVLHNSPPSPKAYASSKYNPLSISPSLSSSNNGVAALKKYLIEYRQRRKMSNKSISLLLITFWRRPVYSNEVDS